MNILHAKAQRKAKLTGIKGVDGIGMMRLNFRVGF